MQRHEEHDSWMSSGRDVVIVALLLNQTHHSCARSSHTRPVRFSFCVVHRLPTYRSGSGHWGRFEISNETEYINSRRMKAWRRSGLRVRVASAATASLACWAFLLAPSRVVQADDALNVDVAEAFGGSVFLYVPSLYYTEYR